MNAAVKTAPARHNCDHHLAAVYPNHNQAEDGERWECSCGKKYEHFCDEAEGCYWVEA